MSRSAQKLAEEAAYTRLRNAPLPRYPGRINRTKYHILRDTTAKQLSQFATVYVEHQERGFIGEVLTDAEFFTITGQNVPYATPDDDEDQYDPDIDDTMTDSEKKRREGVWGDRLMCIATRRGALRGAKENLMDAIDSKYYEDLEDRFDGYKNVTIKDFFNHLNDVWCKLSLDAVETEKQHYFRPVTFDKNTTVAKFAKTLDDEQTNLTRDNIIIPDADKQHHFLMQIRKARKFEKAEWRVYDKKATAQKTWDLTKAYFKELEIDDETLNQDEEIGSIRGGGYESSNHVEEARNAIEWEQREKTIEQNEKILGLLSTMATKEKAAAAVSAPPSSKPDTALAVEESANAVDTKKMMDMMMTMMREVTALKQQVNNGNTNNNNRENFNPNNRNTVLGPPCKHCGKQHPHMPNHKLGTEAACPGRDWPNHIKDSKAKDDRFFIERMNKRTGIVYKKE